jgi:DNA-binding GntR family transcriptional regulator
MDDYMRKVINLVNLSQDLPLNQIVYNGLRTAIIKGIIPVGERINEKKYSIELNVSRTPIREALYRIQAEGLIDHIPNSGFIVKKVTVEDAEEIYKIRIALDTLATINAMERMKDEDFKMMKALLDKTEECEERGDFSAVFKLFGDFNNMIYEFANMPMLKVIIHNMRDYLARFRDISLIDDNRRKKAFDEHKLIYYCLRDKDERELTELIKKHLIYSRKFVIDEIKKQDDLGI